MRKSMRQMGKTALHWVIFGAFAVLSVSAITFALTYNWSDPSTIRNKASGNTLTSTGWNLLVGNVDNLNERLTSVEWGAVVPSGAVMAFNLAGCPAGWSEYVPARGRFIRGIDSAWTNDPDGVRTTWSVQADAFQWHVHSIAGLKNAVLWGWSTHWNSAPGYSDTWSSQLIGNPLNDGVDGTPRTANETRPKNVALLYCVKN